MDLQTMGDKAVTSEDVPSIDNLRAHSPQIPDDNRLQPDTSAIDDPSPQTSAARPFTVRPQRRAADRGVLGMSAEDTRVGHSQVVWAPDFTSHVFRKTKTTATILDKPACLPVPSPISSDMPNRRLP
jgi:hypothetical protein